MKKVWGRNGPKNKELTTKLFYKLLIESNLVQHFASVEKNYSDNWMNLADNLFRMSHFISMVSDVVV